MKVILKTARPMIVCLCNNLNDRCVREAIEAGAQTPEAVQSHYGRAVNCGSCVEHMEGMIALSRSAFRHAAE